jgi:RNA recognition motif-containing protein
MTRARKQSRTNESHSKLFVGNLPCNASDQELYQLFAQFGEILEIHCLGASGSRSGQACAFVKFLNDESGIAAIHQLHGKVALRSHDIPELLLQVRPARSHGSNENSYTSHYGESPRHGFLSDPSTKLFIGNLPRDATLEELNTFLTSIGVQIFETDSIILSGKVNANNAVSAFIFTKSHDDTTRAIHLIDGRLALRPNGQLLRARVAHDKINGQGCGFELPPRPRTFSDSTILHPSAYGPGNFFFPGQYPMSWSADASFKTYHHYMLMPQSPNYGPLSITPNMDPWRGSGIYSLPRPSFT